MEKLIVIKSNGSISIFTFFLTHYYENTILTCIAVLFRRQLENTPNVLLGFNLLNRYLIPRWFILRVALTNRSFH